MIATTKLWFIYVLSDDVQYNELVLHNNELENDYEKCSDDDDDDENNHEQDSIIIDNSVKVCSCRDYDNNGVSDNDNDYDNDDEGEEEQAYK